MSQVKLFSSSGGARVAKRSGRQKKQKVKKPLKTLAIWLLVILCLEGLYFFCIYTNNSFVKKWRTIYITPPWIPCGTSGWRRISSPRT